MASLTAASLRAICFLLRADVLMLGGNMGIEPDIHALLIGEFATIFIFV